mmetsp:Transcript_77344/g.244378  ORF Transcript_77344/g.244378 Transcript_77344/m.244378 type:complete len:238 (+) Transcript_77344:1630-2343(+)
MHDLNRGGGPADNVPGHVCERNDRLHGGGRPHRGVDADAGGSRDAVAQPPKRDCNHESLSRRREDRQCLGKDALRGRLPFREAARHAPADARWRDWPLPGENHPLHGGNVWLLPLGEGEGGRRVPLRPRALLRRVRLREAEAGAPLRLRGRPAGLEGREPAACLRRGERDEQGQVAGGGGRPSLRGVPGGRGDAEADAQGLPQDGGAGARRLRAREVRPHGARPLHLPSGRCRLGPA